MGHIGEEQGAHLIGNGAEGGEVPDARVGGGAGHDHPRPVLAGQRADLVHVDQVRLAVDVVRHEVVVLPAEVDRRPVGEVPTLVEAQPQDGVAALEQRVVDGHVGLGAGMRLDVDVLGAEELLRAIARQVLGHVDDLAAAVVATAGVALGVLAGQDRAHRLEHGQARVVLGCDQLEVAAGALLLVTDDLPDLGILGLERRPEVHAASVVGACKPRSTLATGPLTAAAEPTVPQGDIWVSERCRAGGPAHPWPALTSPSGPTRTSDPSRMIVAAWKRRADVQVAHRFGRALHGCRMPMAVSATCAIIATVQTRPNAARRRPCPGLGGAIASRACFQRGHDRQHGSADDREDTRIDDGREPQPRRDPERLLVPNWRSPTPSPDRRRRDRSQLRRMRARALPRRAARRCARGLRPAPNARRFPPRVSPSSRRQACRRSCTR